MKCFAEGGVFQRPIRAIRSFIQHRSVQEGKWERKGVVMTLFDGGEKAF